VLDENPMLNQNYIKLSGTGGGKGDNHRKFIAALLGAVQFGNGGSKEDLVYNEEGQYSIRISTRFNSKWGDINIGRWVLMANDPERFLKSPELDRLENGSPEEKDVLRRRVVIESIASLFKERAFIINVVGTDGNIQHLAFDIGNCLRSAYLDGKLVMRTKTNDAMEAFIDESGAIVPVPNMSIYYLHETEQFSSSIKPEIEEIEFIRVEDNTLFLAAQLDTIKEASTILQGMLFKESPWQGNPTDLMRVSRCVPSLQEILARQC
jgi:hypothetical protein